MSKYLVTGDEGQLGARVSEALRYDGDKVVGFDIKSGSDIRNVERVDAAIAGQGFDGIVHLSGIPWPMADKTTSDYWRTNVGGAQIITEAAVKHGVPKLVFSSSTAYYGFNRGFPFGDSPADVFSDNVVQRYWAASGKPDMADPAMRAGIQYMISKAAAESAIALYAMTGDIDAVILRLAPIGDKPYGEWKIKCALVLAVDAIVWALKCTFTETLAIFNVGDKGNEYLDTYDVIPRRG